jgi:TrmH RNA methyltransferase
VSTNNPHPHSLILRGQTAVLACLKYHPKALREIVTTAAHFPALNEYQPQLKELRVKTRIVGPIELSQIAQGRCDDDVCALTQRPELGLARVGDFTDWRDARETIVIADQFERPEDLATLARSMASFGLERLLLSAGSEKLAYHPEAWALAQGALEKIKLMRAAALGGLLKLVEDRCCVVALSSQHGRKIDLSTPVRVPARHLALLIPNGPLDPDLQARTEHCFRFPGQPPLSLQETIPIAIAWMADTPKPRADGFLARKKARHAKGNPPSSTP